MWKKAYPHPTKEPRWWNFWLEYRFLRQWLQSGQVLYRGESPTSGIKGPIIWGGADVIIKNKVCNKCHVLESPPNHPSLHPHPWKNCRPWNRSLVPKKVGDHCFKWYPPKVPWWPLNPQNFFQALTALCFVQACKINVSCKPSANPGNNE